MKLVSGGPAMSMVILSWRFQDYSRASPSIRHFGWVKSEGQLIAPTWPRVETRLNCSYSLGHLQEFENQPYPAASFFFSAR
jgi:hypothetical protein